MAVTAGQRRVLAGGKAVEHVEQRGERARAGLGGEMAR
jgi:hypothetical protein